MSADGLMSELRKLRVATTKARAMGWRAAVRLMWRRMLRNATRQSVDEASIAFEVLSEQVRRGVMIDVGAHFGGSLAPFVSSGWVVLAFEPDKRNRAVLQTAFGHRENIRIDPRAVTDTRRENVTLFRSSLSTGISSLAAFHPSHKPSDLVDSVSLTDALIEYAMDTVDFLKIDTEGFDLFVLRGVPWTTCHPRLVLCEFEDAKTGPLGYTYHDLATFLRERGYRVIVSEWWPVETYGSSHRWRTYATYPCELQDKTGWGNLLATRDPRVFAALNERFELSSHEILSLASMVDSRPRS